MNSEDVELLALLERNRGNDLRDQFASSAIACAAWGSDSIDPKTAAKKAYDIADAMLKERKRTP
jgi:hypothetical protein